MQKICEICGDVFTPFKAAQHIQRQCGAEACKQELVYRRNRRNTERYRQESIRFQKSFKVFCIICKEQIVKKKTHKRKFCSRMCMLRGIRIKAWERQIAELSDPAYAQKRIAELEGMIKTFKESWPKDAARGP